MHKSPCISRSPSLQTRYKAHRGCQQERTKSAHTQKKHIGATHYELLMACLLLNLSQKTRVSLLSQ